jgi:hypothetical protein
MPAPSKNFQNIPDGDIDPESPFTTALATAYRDNDVHNYEWIGYGYTPAQAHDHDGVNSKLLPSVIMGNIFAFQNFT